MDEFSPSSYRRTRIAPSALPSSAILIDQSRERTSWSEGMFVTPMHFNRDQSYVVARQAELGQAIGSGVVEGLRVTRSEDDPTSLVVSPGLGVGGSGESVVLHSSARIRLADIALQKSLTQSAGLQKSLQLISESRTGLFVLCATPVEYTSNPVGSFATDADGQRQLHDSVVNEATLFTLIPYTLNTTADSAQTRRSNAARRIFLNEALPDIPSASVPLAMMELDGNVIVWLDEHLVRREAGAARADAFGLGIVNTPARIAHFRQYQEVLEEMVSGAPGTGFAASDRFDLLPPMGRMPAASIASRTPIPGADPVLSHNWLPAATPVELTVLPEDEIDQLLEESLTLPPIDLHASNDVLAQTPVTIIIPVPRVQWASTPLEIVQQKLKLEAAAPLGNAPTSPADLILKLLEGERDTDLIDPTVSAEWLSLLDGRTTLWYARRRQFSRTDSLVGEAFAFRELELVGGEPPDPTEDPGDGPGVLPPEDEDPEADPPVPPTIIGERFSESIRAILRPIGLAPFYDRIDVEDTADGREALAEISAGFADMMGAYSYTATTDMMHRAAASSPLSAARAQEIRGLYKPEVVATRLAPIEGLLTGGLVDLVIPQFTGRSIGTPIPSQFARTANASVDPEPVAKLEVPDEMIERVAELLNQLGITDLSAAAILHRGGGILELDDPRDTELRVKILSIAFDLKIPITTDIRNPGSIEAQTRRNLLARAGTLPRVVEKLGNVDLPDLFTPLATHITSFDSVFSGSATNAIASIRLSTERIAGA